MGRERQQRSIGLFIESLADSFWHELVTAVASSAKQHNVQLIVFVGGTLNGPKRADQHENRAFQLAHAWPLDGLLATPLGYCASVERLAAFYDRYAPLPMAALTAVMPNLPSVCTDNCQAMREAVEHLIRVHGIERIAFIRGPSLNSEAELRFRGYQQALQLHGIALDPDIVLQGDFTYESGQRAVSELHRQPSTHFKAIVAANDSMALGALAELSSLGVQVPGEVAIVSFDDVPEGRWGRPSLSTVRQSLTDLASGALEQLLKLMAQKSSFHLTQIPGCLMLRESCGCLDVRAGAQWTISADQVSGELSEFLEGLLQELTPGGSEWLPRNWRKSLAEKFAWQVEEGTGQFLTYLEDLLEKAAATGHALGNWQRVVSSLRQGLSPEQLWAEEDNLYAARILVGQAAERQQAAFRMQSEWLVQASLDAGAEVFGSFSELRMFAALADRLPEIGIGTCLVIVEEPIEAEKQTAVRKVIFAYVGGRRVQLADSGLLVPDGSPYPPGLGLEEVPALTVASLYSGDRFMGTIFLELGPAVGQVYDWLRQQVGVALQGARMLRQVAVDAEQRGDWERRQLAQQLEIAAQVQKSVLPGEVLVPGLSVAATMIAATEVGGDCYDVLPVPGGCWFSIGDVAGHGLGPGVVVMSLQSSVAALVRANPQASPIEILSAANSVLFDIVRRRLRRDEHATMTLIRYEETGRCVFAGAHEDLIIYRARTGDVTLLDTPGPWLGILPDIRDATELGEFWLEPGDVLLLYTDGILEAMNGERQQFGMERLVSELQRLHERPVEAIVELLLEKVRGWTGSPADDVTLVAIRQLEFRPSLLSQ